VIYLAYPNNPTGNLWDAAVIERIVARPGRAGRSGGDGRGLPALCQPNATWTALRRHTACAVDARTVTKFGLAGVRHAPS